MSKETDEIKNSARLLGSISVVYFLSAIYLGLTAFAMHGTLEEIENAVYSLGICGFVGAFGTIAYLVIRKSMLKRKEPEEELKNDE